ncbi:unnamed protein product [Mortierella alpina]
MVHNYSLDTHTYFDVKIRPERVDQVLAWTQAAAQDENSALAGVEYVGHVGELTNHLLYRVPKHQDDPKDDGLEEQRNKRVVDTLSTVQGVLQVDIQTLRQRAKRDEL